ncbi:MAG: FxsA family protein [Thiolinea sp.]
MLMTPGFFTDALGFACLLPFSRQWLAKRMLRQVTVRQFGQSGSKGPEMHTHQQQPPFSRNQPVTTLVIPLPWKVTISARIRRQFVIWSSLFPVMPQLCPNYAFFLCGSLDIKTFALIISTHYS